MAIGGRHRGEFFVTGPFLLQINNAHYFCVSDRKTIIYITVRLNALNERNIVIENISRENEARLRGMIEKA